MAVNKGTDILIIGAGITGLSTALALHRAGYRPRVLEQAAALTEVGAGLTVGPNAARVLVALGLGADLEARGQVPRHSGTLDYQTGELLSYRERGAAYVTEFGAPFWHVHRADLVDMLRRAIADAVPIHLNHCLVKVDATPERVDAFFANGERFRADVLIACDGLKSPVRTQTFDDHPPEFTGFVAWRGLVPREAVVDYTPDPDFAVSVGAGQAFTRYTVRQGSLVNFVGLARQPEWTREGWMVPASRAELRQQFEGWHSGVTGLLDALPRRGCFKWGLHVREPLQAWATDNIVLAGDAAHPMTPFLGVGAGMGIEDAWVMAEAFKRSARVSEALQRFQSARIERTNRVQTESTLQGLQLLGAGGKSSAQTPLVGSDPLGIFAYDVTTVRV